MSTSPPPLPDETLPSDSTLTSIFPKSLRRKRNSPSLPSVSNKTKKAKTGIKTSKTSKTSKKSKSNPGTPLLDMITTTPRSNGPKSKSKYSPFYLLPVPESVPQVNSFADSYIDNPFNPKSQGWFELIENDSNQLHVPYSALAAVLAEIEEDSQRITKTRLLCDIFRNIINDCPEDLLPAVYLTTNSLGPAYKGLVLGVGDAQIHSAIRNVTGLTTKQLTDAKKKYGDAGTVLFQYTGKQTTLSFAPEHKNLTIDSVFDTLIKIATESGQNCDMRKNNLIIQLFVRAKDDELKFLPRHLQCALRIGLGSETVLTALAHALILTPPFATPSQRSKHYKYLLQHPRTLQEQISAAEFILKNAFAQLPDWEQILRVALNEKLDNVTTKCHMRPGTPIQCMCAQPTKGFQEVIKRVQGLEITCEYKYDGERAQIHCFDSQVKVFSRNMDDQSGKYPDIIQDIPKAIRPGKTVTSFILDSESTAFDRSTGLILPFSFVQSRARKDVAVSQVKTTVCVFGFDLLYLNGEILLEKTFKERRSLLYEYFQEIPGIFQFATRQDFIIPPDFVFDDGSGTLFGLDDDEEESISSSSPFSNTSENDSDDSQNFDDSELENPPTKTKPNTPHNPHTEPDLTLKNDAISCQLKAFMNQSIIDKCEGLMVKTLVENSEYTPAKRTYNWLKIKKDYISGMGDSIDCVPLGGYHGSGKRRGVYGGYLLGIYDQSSDCFQSVCKVGTGFSDEVLTEFTQFYSRPVVISSIKPRNFIVDSNLDCDVWFQISHVQVWEIAGADITLSPIHAAAKGLIDPQKGIAIRFPRFLRIRHDKTINTTTTPEQLQTMFENQENQTSHT